MTIAILGAGPHGHQLADLHPYMDVHFYDDDLPGYDPVIDGANQSKWIIGAAWPGVRRSIATRVADAAFKPYDNGTVFYPSSKRGIDVRVGKHVHVQYNAVLSHGCVLGDFVTVCPGAVLSGEVTVGDDVFIGANATVIHGGITIGNGATIGAGAVVIRDVEPGAVVVGNPARRIR